MWRLSYLAAVVVCLVPAVAQPLELKDERATYGPYGPPRADNRYMAGDLLFMHYTIADIAVDKKTGRARYSTALEVFDPKGAIVFRKETPNEVEPMLGGNVLPGDLNVTIGTDQEAGKYKVKLTISDKIAKQKKGFTYEFEVVPKQFGLAGIQAPAVSVPGQTYVAHFNLVNLGMDAKKQPKAEIRMQVLDAVDKKPVTEPVVASLPRDLPEGINLKKANFVPMYFPVYLNRPGDFLVEIDAQDKISNKQAKVRLLLKVIDTAKIGKAE